MVVGIARVTLAVPGAQSLKDKRMVLRRLKDRVRQRFNAAIAEVEDNDLWQRAVIGLATVANERGFLESKLDEILTFIRAEVDVVDDEKEVQEFDPAHPADWRHWEP